jgi:DnaJ like chaperone protein
MSWAKWIGGGLGWAFGGPIGALLGFVFGSVIDNIDFKSSPAVQQTMQGDFMASLLVLTAAVMKADNKVLRAELDYVKGFMLQQFGTELTRRYMIALRDILKQQVPVHDVCEQIGQYMEYPLRLQLMHYLYGIAASDGEVHASEVSLLGNIAAYMGIDAADEASIRAMFVKDASSAYRVLEVSSDASDDDIRKAYRAMAQKYHPDKVTHLGHEMQKAAQEKFQALNSAYNEIRRQRGMK